MTTVRKFCITFVATHAPQKLDKLRECEGFVTISRIDFHTPNPQIGDRVTRRILLALAFSLCACSRSEFTSDPGSVPEMRVVRIDRADTPLTGLSGDLLDRFRAGDELFEAMFREVDGLGPLFARASCSNCHAGDSRGPGLVVRAGKVDPHLPNERLRALLPFGDMERPYVTGFALPLLLAETSEIRKSSRLPPAVFGRGYIEAVDDASILAGAQRSRPGSPISGRVAHLTYGQSQVASIGRFGLKARTPDLTAFTAEALHGDMGLTSSTHPDEPPNQGEVRDDKKPGLDVTDEQVKNLADYVRMLELPARTSRADEPGAGLFVELECAACHTPTLRTRLDYPVVQLANIDAPIYSDLLLHDMGEELADGIVEGAADEREWRTAPLIGLRFQSAFLHDGRASNVEEAILLHGGRGSEAAHSQSAFAALDPSHREALLHFVQGL